MSRRTLFLIGGTAAALLAAAAVWFFVISPSGGASPQEAVVGHVADRSDAGTGEVLTQQDWGDGQLVLVGYESRGVERLGLAFVSESLFGWRVGAYTEETVEPDDVGVGSMLIASSEGGSGQPAWTAAVGKLTDPRVERVEVTWASSDTSIGPRTNDSYLVVQPGATTATEARFLAEGGTEIARFPIE